MSSSKPVAVVTGVGPGTGAAIARRFAQDGYAVAMLARNADRLVSLERKLAGTKGYRCDVTDEAQIDSTLEAIRNDLGAPKVLIHNAVGGAFGSFMEIDPPGPQQEFPGEYDGAAVSRPAVGAGDGHRGRRRDRCQRNTSALRGKANFAGFAPTKAAQRILAESMARELGPKGVHVAYVLIDAVIDLEWTRKRFANAPDDFFIKPAAIADEIWHVVHQDRSAWSFNVEVRPFRETW
jgi:NAD(P)-dependent dehydrogenase (short-subunit alcohol dehydrogenase family)